MAETSSKTKYYVGVDLGGTKILSGVFRNSLECVGTAKLSTKSQRGVPAVIERVARCVREALDEADLPLKQVAGVGVGAPGAVNFAEGRVIFAPNMEGWKDVPLKKRLEKQLGLPVFIENDCNIAALGVHVAELKAKPRSLIGIFVGTGIGGGLIINGNLYAGFNHTAGEIGHMVLDVNGPKCGCGNKGCFEALASRTAIFQQIKAGVKDGAKTLLTDMLGDHLDDLRSGDLRKAIRRGDKFVAHIVEDAAEYIGIGVANLVNLFSPEVVVLGGGVMEALADEMMSIIVKTARDYAMPGTMKGVEIIASKLGDAAGITGAAVLARRETR
ncbi:MAG TPA: ROK family protein [Verrucomicrobiota bacterium]|nr:ROK family protein [Verrucomicrobiota bacterium]OQC27029.1 MAG: Glucokinase [Verrucomicrobia bacterium ADurb.Bin063]HCL91284.1 ROK family protein [Limisphaerales bacterium]HRR65802.1 ROK family protein [Candidatus Paceibacterota bacterium]MBP8014724.1 ROK family protein [Verrucomicrobiota bacterium]